uniref:WD_REPEATS_REGION domain-containing protein n=1 Tax=Parascaris equorum TaxID=6256 RepID=A0A914RJP7_PAREQ
HLAALVKFSLLKDGANVEKYRQKFRLYGHTLDVLHTEWSKDGRYLASCGMDNSIIIWDTIVEPFAEVHTLCLLLFTYLYILYCS